MWPWLWCRLLRLAALCDGPPWLFRSRSAWSTTLRSSHTPLRLARRPSRGLDTAHTPYLPAEVDVIHATPSAGASHGAPLSVPPSVRPVPALLTPPPPSFCVMTTEQDARVTENDAKVTWHWSSRWCNQGEMEQPVPRSFFFVLLWCLFNTLFC